MKLWTFLPHPHQCYKVFLFIKVFVTLFMTICILESTALPEPLNERPSDYLRERCPLCFGGKNWSKPEEM